MNLTEEYRAENFLITPRTPDTFWNIISATLLFLRSLTLLVDYLEFYLSYQ